MIVSINQPAYLPWLGYFHRIAISDLHVVLDHVQFEKNSYTNRNKVRIATGSTWLTVPLATSGRFGSLAINELEIAVGQPWATKHWRTLCQTYGRAPYFKQHAPFFEALYGRPWTHLAPMMEEITAYFLQAFGINTRLVFSSKLQSQGGKDELVLNLCREVGATTYLSGPLGRDYLRPEAFGEAGIALRYHDFTHPVYPQAYPGFEPYMAAIDLLFNCGPLSLEVLYQNQPPILK